jgi:hypothetical protein
LQQLEEWQTFSDVIIKVVRYLILFFVANILKVSRGSVVGIATGWMIEKWEFEFRECQEFSLLHIVHTGSGTSPTSYRIDTVGSFPEGKAAEA